VVAVGSGHKVVLVSEQPLLFATINRLDVYQVAGMLLEVFLECPKLELHC